ncbi:MAG: hypothetical protein LBD63_03715 [Mycoplasmataceae bacterium]|jgi:hypothetical protein|nr:hypothetical protein [Mycoplasmataceae bacterium]
MSLSFSDVFKVDYSFVGLTTWLIIYSRRRGVHGISPEVRKLKRAGEFEE